MDLSLVDCVKQLFPITTLSNLDKPINSTSFTFAKHSSPTFNSLRFTNRFKSSTINSSSLQQSDSTSSTSILVSADIQSQVFLMTTSFTIGTSAGEITFTDCVLPSALSPLPTRFTKSSRIEALPFDLILSTESFTKGCYSSFFIAKHAPPSTHSHSIVLSHPSPNTCSQSPRTQQTTSRTTEKAAGPSESPSSLPQM